MAQAHYIRVLVAGSTSHTIAILSTIFRLVYRVWTRRFWWEDVWAAFALIADVICLVCIWLDYNTSSWILAPAFTCVLWPARLSIIFSIIRLANQTVQRQMAYIIAASFGCMWSALLAQKLTLCNIHMCYMGKMFPLSQLITDIIADIALVAAPLYLWQDVGLSRNRKIVILSAFSTSLLITVITIPHTIILIKYAGETTLIFIHVKTALSLFICNILVIVTFVYRVFSKETVDLDHSYTSNGLFTTIIQLPGATDPGTSFFVEGGMVQRRATASKVENASVLDAEGGISMRDDEPEDEKQESTAREAASYTMAASQGELHLHA